MDEPIEKESGSEAEKIHVQAMRHADELWSMEQDNMIKGREDQEFYAGKQWPDAARITREKANRPVITINRIPAFVKQMTGDVRQNTPAIKVSPARGEASQEVADIHNGLIRNIEQNSMASAAYVTAVENAAITGHGAFRVTTGYSNDDGFEQDIRIRRISDPFGAMLDPLAQEPTKSDARYGFVFQPMAKEDFESTYPGKRAEDIKIGQGSAAGWGWRTDTTVIVAEYWYRKPAKKKLYLVGGNVLDEAMVASLSPEARAAFDAAEDKREREVESSEIYSCIVSGREVLSGPSKWAGRYIPIVIVTGEEIVSEGRVIRRGIVRDATDPQMVLNYTRTANVETVALQPKQPFMVTKTQINGYEDDWRSAGGDNAPFLIYNADPMSPGHPNRSQPALASAGLEALSLAAADDLKAVTGIYDASLGARSNETSGRAILARQKEGDTGTFLYIFNLGLAIQHAGNILVDLIPRIYDSSRMVRTLEEDGTDKMVQINQPGRNEMGIETIKNDLSVGEYDVAVRSGPSYATKRQEAAESMLEFIRAVPGAAAVVADLIPKNMDWPGADEFADRLKRTIPPELLGDDGSEDGQSMQQAPMQQEQAPQPPQDPAAMAKAMRDAAETDRIQAETQIKGMAAQEKAQLDREQMQATTEIKQRELELQADRVEIERFKAYADVQFRTAEMLRSVVQAPEPEPEEEYPTQELEPEPDPLRQALSEQSQAVLRQGDAMIQTLERMARAASAPRELIIDPDGTVKGSRTVMSEEIGQ